MSVSTIRPARLVGLTSGAALLVLALAGCVPNNPTSGEALTVDITDTTCVVSANTAQAGAVWGSRLSSPSAWARFSPGVPTD